MNDSVNSDMFRTVFDAMPLLIFVVDEDIKIQEYNAAAADLLALQRSAILQRRGGEVLNCLHATEVPEGCGRAPFCQNCVIRNSVDESFRGDRIVRRRTRMEVIRDDRKQDIYALISVSPLLYEERLLALLMVEDISEIAELKRLIPICSVCKKVQDKKKTWFRVEAYFKEHWDVDFSHGFCPECYQIELDKLEARHSEQKKHFPYFYR